MAKPREHLVVEGVVLRRQPPIIIEWCKTPESANVRSPCGHAARTCVGASQACDRCGFTYCQAHFGPHIRRDVAPRDAWQTMVRKLRRALEKAARRRAARIAPIPVPDLEAEP
jgi:hypothetical protein